MSRSARLQILLLSPYHGGSHAAWANGLARSSRHAFEMLTLPDRFWKWRMHGGAATLARRFLGSPRRVDVIVATDMLDLTTFLALTRSETAAVPVLLYMHENQLTYPLPADGDTGPMRRQLGERDHHYAFVNFASMLAADKVAFNSAYHRDAWFSELPRFLRHFPEHNELASVDALRANSTVVPVGIDCDNAFATVERTSAPATVECTSAPATVECTSAPATVECTSAPATVECTSAPLVVWNQRWEYDKRPELMLQALQEVAARGIPFRVAICGQSFSSSPPAFEDVPRALGERLAHFGFAQTEHYHRLLGDATLTLSTADHEFFGIGVLEAMAHGAFALLPDRLSYPELLSGPEVSETTRRRCLYGSQGELVDGLCQALREGPETSRMGAELARNARRFDWSTVAPQYDEIFSNLRLAGRSPGRRRTSRQ